MYSTKASTKHLWYQFLSFCEDKKHSRSASSKHDRRNTTEERSISRISDACLWKNGWIEQKFTRNFPNNSGKSRLYYMKPTKSCKVKFHCIICTMHINGDICSIYSQNLLKHNHIVCSFVSSTHQAMYMMYN